MRDIEKTISGVKIPEEYDLTLEETKYIGNKDRFEAISTAFSFGFVVGSGVTTMKQKSLLELTREEIRISEEVIRAATDDEIIQLRDIARRIRNRVVLAEKEQG